MEVPDPHINTASPPSAVPNAIFNKVTLPDSLKVVEQFHLRPQARGKTSAGIRENFSEVQSKRPQNLILKKIMLLASPALATAAPRAW